MAGEKPHYCAIAPGHPVHGPYHDTEYGVPQTDETILFERLCLEIFQAGLSWEIVLKKRPAMQVAFDGFSVDKVAAYGEADSLRLLADPAIIRNRLKIKAIIENAKRIQGLRGQGGFAAWLDRHHPQSKEAWVKIFKKQFLFMGGEIAGEFLMSLGLLPGAHRPDCPFFKKIN
jgi:DNA-3-methyladenine glycosylase I